MTIASLDPSAEQPAPSPDPLRILIVDDEQLALLRLRALLEAIEGVELVGEARDGETAIRSIATLSPDLVILDIQMPGQSGLRTAAELPEEARPELIFVTAHERYAPDAFEVDAADYLLKPVRDERLRHAIQRARRRRAMRRDAARADLLQAEMSALRGSSATPSDIGFWVPDREGQRRIPLEAIEWIEAARDYVLLHTSVGSHLLRTTMAALEVKLAGSKLLRVHRSAFVRPDRVVEVKRIGRSLNLYLTDGAAVQVGPSYIGAVKEALRLE